MGISLIHSCASLLRWQSIGCLKRIILTPAVYPRLFQFRHFDIYSTGQKSTLCPNRLRPSQCCFIKQSDSRFPLQFRVGCSLRAQKSIPYPAILAMHESIIHREESSSVSPAQASEQRPPYPTLRANRFPEVTDRTYQRLPTLEIPCSYWCDHGCESILRFFKCSRERARHLRRQKALPTICCGWWVYHKNRPDMFYFVFLMNAIFWTRSAKSSIWFRFHFASSSHCKFDFSMRLYKI